jgi:undecaprenyl pyrophosphate synthase
VARCGLVTFLLWQLAALEIYVTDTLRTDLTGEHFYHALLIINNVIVGLGKFLNLVDS